MVESPHRLSIFKKLLFSLLVIALALVTGYGQKVNFLTNYYPHINTAESAIVDNNYAKALDAYKLGFENVPSGFMKDYFNAAVCAIYSGNVNLTYDYLLKVAQKGLSLDFVKGEPAFAAIQKDSDWREFEVKYLSEKRNFDAKINAKLKERINKLVERDAFFHENNRMTFADSIAAADKQNALELDYIFARYGFPGENEIGCGEGGFPVIQYPFYTIIRRQTADIQVINFSNYLLTAVREGKMLPHFATHIMATTNGADMYFARHLFKIVVDDYPEFKNKSFSGKLNKWVYRAIEPEEERSINELRLQNGMETLEQYRKKILFSLEDTRFLFPYKALASIWYVTDPEIAESYLEGTAVAQ